MIVYDKVEYCCGKIYDKVGWLNNPVLNKEGCGRTGRRLW